MVFFEQRFRVGDKVYIQNPATFYKADEKLQWVKGTISYAHPAFGWCNVVVNGVAHGIWNNEILLESEYYTQHEKVKTGELTRIHIRPPCDGAIYI